MPRGTRSTRAGRVSEAQSSDICIAHVAEEAAVHARQLQVLDLILSAVEITRKGAFAIAYRSPVAKGSRVNGIGQNPVHIWQRPVINANTFVCKIRFQIDTIAKRLQILFIVNGERVVVCTQRGTVNRIDYISMGASMQGHNEVGKTLLFHLSGIAFNFYTFVPRDHTPRGGIQITADADICISQLDIVLYFIQCLVLR